MNITLREWDKRIVRQGTIKLLLAISEVARVAKLGPGTTSAIARNIVTAMDNTDCASPDTWPAALRETVETLRRG